ncbi:MAG: aminotransferase class III-fold pyridoxal phosphate-dependent enzyme [Nitrospirae bacterium]|nr:aminotransferase class III-fold pyridoxal phosphate-dependent enzyme [Magnetococcales bacterium]HAT51360.1 aspartate aminotransferase family protein [Alphaproteobacteria bacterium]
MKHRYRESEALLRRALLTIPLGSQTFSKSKIQFPYGVSPYFIEKGQGCRVWDVDGHEYIDFINSLAAISLGYNDPDVNRAVADQLEKGVIFSLPHRLEMEVAELLVDMVPCVEMVRFGKNGSDATSGAIRLARAYTKRDHVAVCGYHGWQDWYIGSTARYLGVPDVVREMTHTFTYNDIASLEALFVRYPNQLAAVIMEPMNVAFPKDDFLNNVKDLTHRHGALLIFDETITGFRYALGGAQDYFGVIPDLATFGKGMANGYPLSAVGGRREIMRYMEEIFFSFTFGGESLSLAAARATLEKMRREPVHETMWTRGEQVLDGVRKRIAQHEMEHIFDASGQPVWSFLVMKDVNGYSSFEIRTLFMQEVLERGILSLGGHNISFSHRVEDIERLLAVYDEVFPMIKDAVDNRKMAQYLRCEPLQPLFKVR